jgi:hypothetical protein
VQPQFFSGFGTPDLAVREPISLQSLQEVPTSWGLQMAENHVGIDLGSEHVISLAQAARSVPSSQGKTVHAATVWRWIRKGVLAGDGRRVRLDAAKLGGRWVTSKEALQRFLEALTPSFGNPQRGVAPRTPGQRKRAYERAAEALDKEGI